MAQQVARARGLTVTDYRDVIRELKKEQLVGDAILPHLRAAAEGDRGDHQARAVWSRCRRGRRASAWRRAAETAQQPAPHMDRRRR